MSSTFHIPNELTFVLYEKKQVRRIMGAMLVSLACHLAVLLGVTFEFPVPDFDKIATSLDVVLVNSETRIKPADTKLLAQANLDGGGNIDADRRAKTPLPVIPKSKPVRDMHVATEKVKQLEQETQRLMTAVHSDTVIQQNDVVDPTPADKPPAKSDLTSTELLQRSLDIARLRAQIAEDHDTYQKRPKRKFVGARTTEYRFARYVEDWRLKVERIGNLNYPEDAKREKIYGNLQLTVGIRADGSLESIGINRSSGYKMLDDAAVRIVRLAGKNGFAPFPPDISRDTDILHITRTWVFARSDTLMSQ